MAAGAVQVEGLQELVRAFKLMPAEVVEEFTWELLEAAEPVRLAAQEKAATHPSNMVYTREWSGMRVGVSRRDTTVWVAPSIRGGRIRNNPRGAAVWAEEIQVKSLDPALDENTEKVYDKIDDMIDRIADHHGF